MKPFVPLLLALYVSVSVADAKPAKKAAPRVPTVTRDNFVSLSFSTSGGFANLRTDVRVQSNSISKSEEQPFFGGFGGGFRGSSGFPGGGEGNPARGAGSFGGGFGPQPYIAPPPALPLSNNQLDLVLRAINQTRLPALAGKYQQANLADGINETVTLTISDEENRDRTVTIQNTGDTAPRAYYDFTARLRAFVALKFPEPRRPAPTPVPAPPAPTQ